MAVPRSIKIGTDCSGMEAPIQAIRNLPVNYEHKFSCDVNAHARATIEANFPHALMYEDLTKRDNRSAPHVDIYVAGFPCQPFSSSGLQQGFGDKHGRGKIFFKVLDYIRTQKPRVFILENVAGLVRLQKGEYLNAILEQLKNLGIYNIQWKIMDTKKNGVPQSRNRWYCIGIQKEYDTGKFEFPEPIERPSIEQFLDKRDPKLVHVGLPPKSSSTARANVISAIRQVRKKGADPMKEAFIVDCDSTAERSSTMRGYSPCITCSRGAGHWVTNRGRRLLKTELMRLQGMDPTTFTVAVPNGRLGHQLGNTMSVNVLERIFTRLLPAAQLVKKGTVIKDRWENGQALKKLMATRGCGFKGMSAKIKKAADNKEARLRGLKRRAPTSAGGAAKRQR